MAWRRACTVVHRSRLVEIAATNLLVGLVLLVPELLGRFRVERSGAFVDKRVEGRVGRGLVLVVVVRVDTSSHEGRNTVHRDAQRWLALAVLILRKDVLELTARLERVSERLSHLLLEFLLRQVRRVLLPGWVELV